MILVLDTSTSELLAAIADNAGDVLREARHVASAKERGIHDPKLASEAKRLLDELHVHPRQIDRIGLVIGPGSFTGLRIGLSFAKGFAFAQDAKLVTMTQHEVLSAEAGGVADHIVTPGYRPGLYYVANASAPTDIELVDDFSSIAGRVLAHASLMGALPAEVADASYAVITSGALARLTATADRMFSGDELAALEPLYVTDFIPGAR